jgi:hypothetical protein
MLAQRDRDRRQLGDLVALRRGHVDALVLAEAARTGVAALRPLLDHLVYLLERQQRRVAARMTGLAAAASARGWLLRARRRRGRVLRGRQRGGTRVAVEPLLKLGDASLEPPVRLDQLAHPRKQGDRRLPLAVENRLRFRALHGAPVRRRERGPCLQK